MAASIESGFASIKNRIPLLNREAKPLVPERTFSEEEREALIEDGAVIYTLQGKNIDYFQDRVVRYITYSSLDRVNRNKSGIYEVAIYPSPNKFFILGTVGKRLDEITKIMKEDEKELRKRDGLREISLVIPGLADVADVLTEHQNKSGVKLMHQEFGFPYDEYRGKPIQIGTICERGSAFVVPTPGHNWDYDGLDPVVYRERKLDNIGLMHFVIPTKK